MLNLVFFFVVGLEVKREFVTGELRELKHAALPIAAAIGGMLVPAGIYLLLQWGAPGERGWGIPMAIFIAGLALEGELLNHARIGIMTGSSLSALLGMTLIIFATRKGP